MVLFLKYVISFSFIVGLMFIWDWLYAFVCKKIGKSNYGNINFVAEAKENEHLEHKYQYDIRKCNCSSLVSVRSYYMQDGKFYYVKCEKCGEVNGGANEYNIPIARDAFSAIEEWNLEHSNNQMKEK